MALDFSGQNLRGRSFVGRDLTGANFSHSQIQGADFSESTLTGASFHRAKAGTSHRAKVALWAPLILSGAMVGGIGTVIADTVNTDYLTIFGPRDAILAFSVLTILGVVLCLRDLLNAIVVTLLCGLLTWISFIAWEYVYSGDFLHVLVGAEAITVDVITMIVIFWAGLSGVIGLCSVLTASAHFQAHCRRWLGPFEWVTLASGMAIALTAGVYLPGLAAKINAFVDTAIVWGLSVYAARQIVRAHPRYGWFRSIALNAGAWDGTRFRKARLSGADFSLARLNATTFTSATLTRTCFQEAQFLDYARVDDTLLQNAAVRHLIVTGRGARQTYIGLDLRGAYLVDVDLTGADLTDADISRADLTGAQMMETQLVRTQAVATCFRGAQFTGSCLESWNIDTSTQLDNVVCDYIYLLRNQGERRPSHGNFQPGDFTKLFQNVLHTVDLIFREGLDMSAFMSAFQQVQTSGDGLMSVRSIENKGDGVVVVKVEVPETAEKPQIQAALTQEYEQALNRLEARYRAELAAKDSQLEAKESQLEAKDAQIDLYKQHQSELSQLTKLLTQSPVQEAREAVAVPLAVPLAAPIAGKRVVLRLGALNLAGAAHGEFSDIPVTLQIGDEGSSPQLEAAGQLPPPQPLLATHQRWQRAYRQVALQLSQTSTAQSVRLEVPSVQVTNVSYGELFDQCAEAEETLIRQVNAWLDSEPFRPVREALMMSVKQEASVRFFLQTDDLRIRTLPLHLWRWFDRYSRAELVLSESNYRPISTTVSLPQTSEETSTTGNVRVLAVLGDGQGLDIERDRTLLSQLPDVALTCLVEPTRSQLNDTLWSQPWDILFFAGHSVCQNAQHQLRINATESLSLKELKYALKKATERGLKLALLNACDGLQLLQDLNELSLPPTIVMRYPVPDLVAQTFLKYFLSAFSQGAPLHQAVRDAREQLQGIESQFPFATWLPVLHQNPASPPLTWSSLK